LTRVDVGVCFDVAVKCRAVGTMLLNPDDGRPPWSRTAVPVGETPGTVILRRAYPPLVWGRIRHPSFFFEKRA
jgi:hypothetical protein